MQIIKPLILLWSASLVTCTPTVKSLALVNRQAVADVGGLPPDPDPIFLEAQELRNQILASNDNRRHAYVAYNKVKGYFSITVSCVMSYSMIKTFRSARGFGKGCKDDFRYFVKYKWQEKFPATFLATVAAVILSSSLDIDVSDIVEETSNSQVWGVMVTSASTLKSRVGTPGSMTASWPRSERTYNTEMLATSEKWLNLAHPR
ncbi:MAG: hypothetical protein M1833_000961 [Piccolia ochrophora]|nr:MAG: hypothetical protein M1833_000961 [Piccolia ochrophora]